MSTVTLEIDPKLFRQAESVLDSIGMKYSDAVNLFTRQIVIRNALPLELKGDNRPPIPCINDLTDEEIFMLFEEGVESIKAGHYYTSEQVNRIISAAESLRTVGAILICFRKKFFYHAAENSKI